MEPSLSQPLVSAIVSTYNSERFIRGCIEDLEHQTISHQLEIIVIDSASPQKEGKIVRELQQRYGNIRYLRTDQRETVYAAWNRGIALARGRYITNANSDDRHRTDAFELMTRVMESCPGIDLVYGDVLVTNTPNETFARHTQSGRYRWYDWDRNILLDKGCFIGPQPMWRRSLHELYGGFDPAYVTSGDYEFWLRISQTSDFFHIKQPLGLYLAHPESIEHQNEDKKGRENSSILNLYRQAAREECIVGLLPFQQMRTLDAENVSPLKHAQLMRLVEVIEAGILAKTALAHNRMENYHLIKSRLLHGTRPAANLIEEYLNSTGQLILSGKEWYTSRRSVEDTSTADEAPLRLELLSTALQKARLLFQRDNVDGAVSLLLNQGIKAAPSSPVAYLELADILLASGRYEDALQVLPEMPPSADTLRLFEIQAICYASLGQDEVARQAALQAVGRPRAVATLGTLAARSGNVGMAEAYFRQAIEADSSCSSALLSLGMLLWGRGDQQGAYQAVRQAVVADPLNCEAVNILTDMAVRLVQLPDALQMLFYATQLYPDSRNLGRHYANLLARSGRDREALEACETFLVRFDADDELLGLALQLRQRIGLHDCVAVAGTQSISLCMIVKNEEKNLPGCLASLKPVVDELIVVDTGSTDRTVDIASAFGARVCNFTWNGNFSDARNYAIDKATGRWILVMDSDEVLAAQDFETVRRAVREADGKNLAWSILTRNYTTRVNAQGWTPNDHVYPLEERADGWHPSWKVRLFPHDRRIHFSGEVHEMVEHSLRQAGFTIKPAGVVIHHYGGLNDVKNREKMLQYFDLGRQKLEEHPDDCIALQELATQAGELELYDEAITLWDRVLKINPDSVDALFNKGYNLIGLRRYEEALVVSKKVLDLEPFHKEAAFNYGTSELYVGNSAIAVQRLEPILEKNPNYPPLLAIMTLLYLLSDQREKAVFIFATLKTLNYAIVDYAKDRGLMLRTLGKELLARKLMDECLAIGMDMN